MNGLLIFRRRRGGRLEGSLGAAHRRYTSLQCDKSKVIDGTTTFNGLKGQGPPIEVSHVREHHAVGVEASRTHESYKHTQRRSEVVQFVTSM